MLGYARKDINMGFEKKIFDDYFSNQINVENFITSLGIDDKGFHIKLHEELEKNIVQRDSQMLEFLIYALMLWEEKGSNVENITLNFFLEILNELVLYGWHEQHENIVNLLQMISDESSIEPLYNTIYLNLQYLEWDDNYSLQKKCIRVVASIGGEKAIGCLEILKQDDNAIIRELAKKKLEQLKAKSF